MPTTFPAVNLSNWYNNIGYVPGAGPFYWADKFYQNQLKGNAQGQGAAQLAGARADDPSAANYRQTPFVDAGAGQNAGLAALSRLLDTHRQAAAQARQVQGQTTAADLSGTLQTASDVGSSIESQLQAQIALRNAQAAQANSVIGDIQGGIDLAGGIGSEIIAPGNPMGINMALQGGGQIAGANGVDGTGGGSSSTGGMGGILSQFYNKFFPGSEANAGINGLDPGFGGNIDPSQFSLLSGMGAP